ncbi:metal ABC transporter substrate-binding protein, partial [Planctomycetota bacterium]
MRRKRSIFVFCLLWMLWFSGVALATVRVVTTLPDYADLVQAIGKDHVQVTAIVRGDQDAHFIRPKPSFALALRKADLLVTTGLDLELWLQTVVDNAGNSRIRSGQEG